MKSYVTRKYNGVNHDLSFYQNQDDFAMNRKNQYFLTNRNAEPSEIIRQVRPLSVKSQLIPSVSSELNIFPPEAANSQIEIIPNACDYDVIIVSGLYADIARQTQSSDSDYLDRLYTPITLYAEDPQNTSYNVPKIGCVGFRKVWYSHTPQEYVMALRSGYLPSVTSMRFCVDMCHSQRAYCDFYTMSWLRELENYLTTI